MNFRRKLTSKIAIVATLVVIASLVIALVAMPAGAVNQTPAQPGGGEVLNSPGPPPTMINYQGYLTDADGDPINDTLEMTFSIYETAEATTPLWTETQPSVEVINGLFNVLLGSVNPINASHLTGESYLGIQVGADPEMTPRQQIVSVAYAFHADKANDTDTVDGMDSAEFVAVAGDEMTGQLILPTDGLVAGTDQLVLTDGKVGIGTNSPGDYKLYVKGGSNNGICAEGNTYSVYGYHSDSGNYGQLGTIGYGVYGYHNASGNHGTLATRYYGVSGWSSQRYGVYGVHSTSGNYGFIGSSAEGVYGRYSSNYGRLGTSDEGVYGEHSGSGNYGRLGTNDEGVYGYHNSGNYGRLGTSTHGVYGRHNSGNLGILGTVDEGVYAVGASWGVHGRSYGGWGVYGINTDSNNSGRIGTSDEGVYGKNYSSGNYGRIGTSDEGAYGEHATSGNYGQLGTTSYGVYGKHSNDVYGYIGGSTYGVYGKNNTTGNYGMLGTNYDGVYGRSYHSLGYGVYGTHTSGNSGRLGTSTSGVYGSATSAGGTGVSGWGPIDGYDFFAAGPGGNYGPFTGAHEVKLASGFMEDIMPGLIVSVTGETQVRTDKGEISYSSTLPTVQLSDTPNDKKVFGVVISESPLPEDHWYEAGEAERFGIVNALGEGRVWVTNINGDIVAGDYITTSAVAGYGQKQDDDLLHSYTLGKAIETVDWSQVTETIDFNGQTYKTYPIAVVYTSG